MPETLDLSKPFISIPPLPDGECRDIRVIKNGIDLGYLKVCGTKDGIKISDLSPWEKGMHEYQRKKGEI